MNLDPDWALYRTFLAVLDEGSLSAAARALGTTQPTVARHVDALEAALGADLFVRSQRGLEPTELALSLRLQARTMATTAAALLRIASGAQGDFVGTVRITASDVVGVEHLPPILTRLRRAHPALVIELSLSDRVGDLLRARRTSRSAWSSRPRGRCWRAACRRWISGSTPIATIWPEPGHRPSSTTSPPTT